MPLHHPIHLHLLIPLLILVLFTGCENPNRPLSYPQPPVPPEMPTPPPFPEGLPPSLKKDIQFELERERSLQSLPSLRPISTEVIEGFYPKETPGPPGLTYEVTKLQAVYAPGAAKIQLINLQKNENGWIVDLYHEDQYVTHFEHLDSLAVSDKQKVRRGDLLGYTRSNLKYCLRQGKEWLDPIDFYYSDLMPEEYNELRKSAEEDE